MPGKRNAISLARHIVRQTTRIGLHNLADLQKITVRVAEKAANLSAPGDGRRQEDSPACLEYFIGGLTVRHSKRQFMTDRIGIFWRSKCDRGFIPGRLAACHQEQPASLKSEDARCPSIFAVD